MAQGVILSEPDLSVLRLLDATPLTAALLRKVSLTFSEEPFRDERRVRERMQTLTEAGCGDWCMRQRRIDFLGRHRP